MTLLESFLLGAAWVIYRSHPSRDARDAAYRFFWDAVHTPGVGDELVEARLEGCRWGCA